MPGTQQIFTAASLASLCDSVISTAKEAGKVFDDFILHSWQRTKGVGHNTRLIK